MDASITVIFQDGYETYYDVYKAKSWVSFTCDDPLWKVESVTYRIESGYGDNSCQVWTVDKHANISRYSGETEVIDDDMVGHIFLPHTENVIFFFCFIELEENMFRQSNVAQMRNQFENEFNANFPTMTLRPSFV